MELTKRELGISTQPWEMAEAQFLEDLPEAQKALFQESSLENLFRETSTAYASYSANSKLQALSKKLRPFIESLDGYGKAMDIYANGSSIICPLWGSVRVVLHIAQEYNKYFDKLVDMFSRIGDVLPRFRTYEGLFPTHMPLRQALCEAYFCIIGFCIDAKSVFLKAKSSTVSWVAIKPLWKPFAARFDNYLSQFRHLKKRVEEEALVSHLIEAKRTRELQEQDIRARQRQKILSLLSAVDYRSHHRKLQELRHQGTGSWLAETGKFRTWLECKSSSCLCCFGIPGSGKTILASSIVDSLSPFYMEVDSAICYYYCDYKNVATLEASTMFGTLTKQLLERIELPPDLTGRIKNHFPEGITLPHAEDAIELLMKTACYFDRILILIDGTDEQSTKDQKVVINAIKRLVNHPSTTVKIIVFSRREEHTIRHSLQQYDFIDISIDLVRSDISKFITDNVNQRLNNSELTIRNPALKQVIIDTLVKGAKDMFLWVKFQLEDICCCLTDDEIRSTLENLPKDLAATYSRIVQKLYKSEGGERKINILKKILPWIICAKRPLTLDELNEAYAVDLDDKELDRRKIPTDYNRILQACGSLVLFDVADKTVTLAHYTIKQFILNSSGCEAETNLLNFELQNAECSVGEACITYLGFSDFETQLVQQEVSTVPIKSEVVQGLGLNQLPFGNILSRVATRLYSSNSSNSPQEERSLTFPKPAPRFSELAKNYYLLEYVTSYWFYHTSYLTPEQNQTWTRFRKLTFENTPHFDMRPWKKQKLEDGHYRWPNTDLFYWAVEQDLVVFLYLINNMKRHSSVVIPGVYNYVLHEIEAGRELFRHICEFGSAAVLEYLWSYLINSRGLPNRWSVEALPPIQCAITNGHDAVIKVLLEHDYCRINTRFSGKKSLLSIAAESGNEHIVTFLIEQKDINVNITDTNYQTPLILAVIKGHEGVVKRLLEHKDVDINHNDTLGRTPLMWAVRKKQEQIAKLLLERDELDVDLKDDNFITALDSACITKQEAIVDLIVTRTVDSESALRRVKDTE